MRISDWSSDVCSSDPETDIADIRHRRRVRANFRSGQTKTRNLAAIDQAGQPFPFLFVGAVVHQQLAGAERVRHHYRHRQRDRFACELGHDRRLRVGRKAERSEEHTSELQSLMRISYAVFCLKKKNKNNKTTNNTPTKQLQQNDKESTYN